jgi:hypothetical protein
MLLAMVDRFSRQKNSKVTFKAGYFMSVGHKILPEKFINNILPATGFVVDMGQFYLLVRKSKMMFKVKDDV